MVAKQITGRNLSIDLVKVVAMMCVMVLHIPSMWRADDNLLAFTMSRSAGIAIPLFFMVSGFLLFGRKPDFRYSMKKIIGIVKFVLIISLSWTLGYSLLKHHFDWSEILKAFYGPFVQDGILGVFWYLGAMCIIYALLPIINRYINIYPPPSVSNQNAGAVRLLSLIAILIVINSAIFQMNILYGFEKSVIQTFRVWNWVLYFLLGAVVKEFRITHLNISTPIRLTIIILAIIIYIIFQKLSVPTHIGIEYFFGSPVHIAFSFIMFAAIASINIPHSRVIQWLSTLFLPVYAFHQFVIYYLTKYSLIGVNSAGVASPIFNFILVAVVTIGLSALVMKTPYLKNIFKI